MKKLLQGLTHLTQLNNTQSKECHPGLNRVNASRRIVSRTLGGKCMQRLKCSLHGAVGHSLSTNSEPDHTSHLKVTAASSVRQLISGSKPKTGDRIAAISRLVPLTGQFSNSLYANLDEFRALKESLKREGIFDETWETLVIPRRGASSTLPSRP
jgi:hypothetical protein